MQLNEQQTATLKTWIDAGVSLSDIQKHITQEWHMPITYMELRFLIDDLALSFPTPADTGEKTDTNKQPQEAQTGTVSVDIDPINSPNCLASGTVTFSDGASCKWHLDTFGRLAIIPHQKGYKPPADDMPLFQETLQSKLQNRLF